MVETVERLATEGRLAHLAPGPGLREAVEREVQALPFHLRSTYGGNTTCIEVESADAGQHDQWARVGDGRST